MPTGYTADIATGKISDFSEFAWLCARAMGALISLRDEKMETKRPEKFVPGDYHEKALASAQAEVSRLTKMTPDEAQEAYRNAQGERRETRDRINADRAEQKGRYEAMLSMVRAWEPPTAEHIGFKEFMEKQLIESIDFDCNPVDKYYPDIPKLRAWFADEIKEARRLCEYHASEQEKERIRTESRNAWVDALADSLTAEEELAQ